MTKNPFKKGLSVVASAALGSAMLVGFATPAQAAGELKIEPSVGSIWAVPTGEVFNVKTSFSPGYSSSGQTALLKYQVKATGSTAGSKAIHGDVSATLTSVDQVGEVSTEVLATSDADLTASFAAQGAAVGFLGLEVASAVTTATYTVTIQAYVDADDDGAIDAGEWTSALETVTWHKHSDVTFSADIVNPVLNDDDVTVNVTSSTVNLAMGPSDSTTGSIYVARIYTDSTFEQNAMLYYDAVDARLEGSTSSAAMSLDGGSKVKAEIWIADTEGTTADTVYGNRSLAAASETRIEAVATQTVTAVGDVETVNGSDTTATNSNAAKLRSGSGTVVVESSVTFSGVYTTAAVDFIVQENGVSTLSAGGSVTAGGQTLTNASAGTEEEIEDISVTATRTSGLTTGPASLTITYSGLKDGDQFIVDAAAQGFDSNTELVFTVEDASINDVSNIDAIGSNDESGQLVRAVDSVVSLRYVLVDQFGSLYTGAGASVTVSDATKSASASFVNGYADVALTAYDAATTKTMTPTVYLNGTDANITEPTTSVKIGTQGTAATVTALAASGTASDSRVTALGLKAYANADTRSGAVAPTVTASSNTQITGTVSDSSLDGIATSVTLSSPNVMFEHDGVWSIGSITVQTQSDGTYSVEVYSNQAGSQTVTVTSGSASATEVVWWPVAADDAGASLVLTGTPSTIAPGRTLVITGSLTDAFGNPVTADGTGEDFVLTWDGPGFQGTKPTEISADGTFTWSILLGANDTGSGTVTAAYDLDEDGDYTDTGDIAVSQLITIGTNLDAKVNAGSFKGYVAVYARGYEGQRLSAKIGNDWVIVDPIVNNQENGTLHRTVDFTGAGVDIAVRIYIDRVLIDTINLTTK